MKPVGFTLQRAAHANDARRLLGAPGARLLAGGQSLGPMLNLRLARPSALIDIASMQDLRAVRDTVDAIHIGAATTHAEIEDDDGVDPVRRWLARIAGGIAYRAVRNKGTIGGSLAHADPAADWLVTLTALDATIIVASDHGERALAMPGFIAAPFMTDLRDGEIVTGIRVPKRAATARFGYWKFVRKPGEFATASAAVLIDEAAGATRIAVGALEAAPILLLDPTNASAALAAAMPGRASDTLAPHVIAIERAIKNATP